MVEAGAYDASNFNQLLSYLGSMTPQQRVRVGQMHQNDFEVITALSLINSAEARAKQALMTQQAMGQPAAPPVNQQVIAETAQNALPEEVGIGALPAPNMERMAGGGITGEDEVESYAPGGSTGTAKTRFIQEYGDAADQVSAETGIDRNLLLAQWGHETAWGTKTVGKYNLGNIKDVTGKGPKAVDKMEKSKAAYKEYGSPQEFAADYTNLLKRNFPGALNAGSDVGAFTAGLQSGPKGAYATDPDYRKKIAQVATGLMPVSVARAAEPAAPTFDREKAIAQIPGQTEAGRTPTPEARTTRTPLQAALGAGETGLSLLSGVAALPVGLAKSAGQYLVSGKAEPIEKNIGASVYYPRTEAGREYVGDVAQMAEDLKIPAYIPAIGPVSTTARTAAAAKAAEERAAQAAAAAKQAAAPRIPYTLTSDTRNAGQAAQGARALAQQKDEIEAAARASAAAQQEAAAARVGAERVAEEAKYAAGAAQRANIPPAASILAATAEGAPPPEPSTAEPDTSYDRLEKNRLVKQGLATLDAGNVPKQDIIDAAKKTEPENKGKGWDAEDWLMLGLGLMANKSPYFLQALGEAGMGVVKGKKEARKEEREDIYRKALAREATAKAVALESGSGDIAKATAYADKEYDNWLNLIKSNPMLAMNVTQEQAEAKRQQILRDAFAMYKIQPPAGMAAANAGEFKFLGVRPS